MKQVLLFHIKNCSDLKQTMNPTFYGLQTGSKNGSFGIKEITRGNEYTRHGFIESLHEQLWLMKHYSSSCNGTLF